MGMTMFSTKYGLHKTNSGELVNLEKFLNSGTFSGGGGGGVDPKEPDTPREWSFVAEGGETSVNTGFGLKFTTLFINGRKQLEGRAFKTNGSIVRLAEPLVEGDNLELSSRGGISDFTWKHIAIGGEKSLNTGRITRGARVYINGAKQIEGRAFEVRRNIINLAEPLYKDDVVEVVVIKDVDAVSTWTHTGVEGEHTIDAKRSLTDAKLYINGILQVNKVSYEIQGTKIILAEPLLEGDEVEVDTVNTSISLKSLPTLTALHVLDLEIPKGYEETGINRLESTEWIEITVDRSGVIQVSAPEGFEIVDTRAHMMSSNTSVSTSVSIRSYSPRGIELLCSSSDGVVNGLTCMYKLVIKNN